MRPFKWLQNFFDRGINPDRSTTSVEEKEVSEVSSGAQEEVLSPYELRERLKKLDEDEMEVQKKFKEKKDELSIAPQKGFRQICINNAQKELDKKMKQIVADRNMYTAQLKEVESAKEHHA